MHIISLDKKLLTVQHKLAKQQLQELNEKSNVSPADVQNEIQRQIYGKFIAGVGKNIPMSVESNEEEITYTVRGYILSDRQMMETILEICELDDDSKRMMIEKIYKILGING